MTKSMGMVKRLSVALIVVMVCTALFNVAYAGIVPMGTTASTASDVYPGLNNITAEQTNEVDFSDLRKQYMNDALVMANTADFEGERWVIVELEGDSLYDRYDSVSDSISFSDFATSSSGKKIESALRKQQDTFLARLNKYNISYRVKYNFTTLNNGLAIKVNASGYNAIRKMTGVKDVYYSERYAVPTLEQVDNNANVYTTGIYNTNDLNGEKDIDGDGHNDKLQGEGMVVAILDTGLDVTHEAFQTMPSAETAAWTEQTLQSKIEKINRENKTLTATGSIGELYKNLKVPFGYDYADDDPNVFPSYEAHGTHVAGIVAGKSDHVVNAETNEKFVGVAPEAQLAICKVFTDNLYDESLGGADSIDILAALSDCAMLGVDVINMSLGSSAGFSDEKSDTFCNDIYDKIRSAGISLVVAASNDYSSGYGGGNGTNLASNPDSATVGSPSTYAAALSVASINGQKSSYIRANGDDGQIAFITNASDGYGKEIYFVDELFKDANKRKGDTVTLKYVVVGGVGRSNDYTPTVKRELNNKFYTDKDGQTKEADLVAALVKRGDTTFAEKVQMAMSNNADAVIIYNNVSGTIRMSLGEVKDPVPSCSIGMDATQIILSNTKGGKGYFELNYDMEAGPFMSDFSSWGPNPNLELKPEITAHGGEITSAVPGNGYDIFSGTSMAAPNMAGGVAILRQYLKTKLYPTKGNQALTDEENIALNKRVNQVLMSTATVARNDEGNPYSPRKQGAGLAGIVDAVKTKGYISTFDKEGKEMDKTKVELGDDPSKNGVYTFSFEIKNISGETQTYKPNIYVMTETMASDMKTVAEKAFMFDDKYRSVEWKVDGVTLGASDNIVVPGGGTVTAPTSKRVTVTITLNQSAKNYLDANFVNGMFVEGFVSLDNTAEDGVTLGLPYLAFYGDWTASPLFDYDTYEIAESEADTSVLAEDKLKASAAATQIIGMYYNDLYIVPMGTYVYAQDENAVQVYPAREKVALSMYDDSSSGYSIYEMYAVYAGLLRGAAYMDIVITDSVTGEVYYSETQENVGKSYAAGGSNRGAFVRMELNAYNWGLMNNATYNVSLRGQLDYVHEDDYVVFESKYATDKNQYEYYGDSVLIKQTGELKYFKYQLEDGSYRYPAKQRNSFDFEFTADYEAPKLVDYRVRFDPYLDANKQTKYHIYMDLDVYDNQYIMSVLPAYRKYDRSEGREVLTGLTEYAIPVNSERGQQTTVSFEITDYYEEFVKTGKLYVSIDDYAMNSDVYVLKLTGDSLDIPATSNINIKADELGENGDASGKLLKTGTKTAGYAAASYSYNTYSLILRPNQLYKLSATTLDGTSTDALFEKLVWRNTNSAVKAQGAEIFGAGSDNGSVTRTIQLTDGRKKYLYNDKDVDEDNMDVSGVKEMIIAEIEVTVEGPALQKPTPDKITLMPILNADNHNQTLDATGGIAEIELNPNQEIALKVVPSPWYCDIKNFDIKVGNPVIAAPVDGKLAFKTLQEGRTTVTVEATDFNMVSASFAVIVLSQYEVRNYTLYNYYGGPEVTIPKELNVLYLDEYCFRNNTDITKVTLPDTLTSIPERAFTGCSNLKEIYIPGQVGTIFPHAFDGCEQLVKVELGTYVDSKGNPVAGAPGSLGIGEKAFYGCRRLKEITNSNRITTVYKSAFELCVSLQSIDLSNLRVASSRAFAMCYALSGDSITTTADTAFAADMFSNCSGIKNFTFKGTAIPDGLFFGCSDLTSIEFANKGFNSIGAEAFAGTKLSEVTLPGGTLQIGYDAFAKITGLTKIKLSKDTQLEFPIGGAFTGCSKFSAYELASEGSDHYQIKNGALYSTDGKTLISVPIACTQGVDTLLNGVTAIADSAFAGNKSIKAVTLPETVESIGAYAFDSSSVTNVALNSHITVIPEGAFFACEDLTTVTNMDNVATIGDRAFYGTNKLGTLDIKSVTSIGNRAFMDSSLSTLNNTSNVQSVGDSAFMEAQLSSINMPKLAKIGRAAFARMPQLTTAKVGAVTEMGDYAFAALPVQIDENKFRADITVKLSEITFAEGTTAIADYAFASFAMSNEGSDANPYWTPVLNSNALTNVTLPSSVTSIGAYAFAGSSKLQSIDLSHVTYIDDNAFYVNAALTNVTSLGSVKHIGDGAFYGVPITTADLSSAEYIGSSAFAPYYNKYGIKASGGELTSVTFRDLKYLGDHAFYDTKLTSVTLPAGFRSNYVYSWYEPDDKGRVEGNWNRDRNIRAFGDGALSGIKTLKKILVADGNPDFFSEEGVLYSRLANGGYQLEQYPAGCNIVYSYEVKEGTVAIGNNAFEGVISKMTEVDLPYTVERIGNMAFFNCDVKEYIFRNVKAPTLIADYNDYAFEYNMYLYLFYLNEYMSVDLRANENMIWGTNFYANFGDYAVKNDGTMHVLFTYELLQSVQLNYGLPDALAEDVAFARFKMTIPSNSIGYDNPIWACFFDKIDNTTLGNCATSETWDAINTLKELPELTDIRDATREQLVEGGEYAELIAAARVAYNSITDPVQLELPEVKACYEALVAAERTLREVKKDKYNIKVAIKELTIGGNYKIRYDVGEAFDPTGLVVKVIYDDGTEDILNAGDYSFDKATFSAGDRSIDVIFVDEDGIEHRCTIAVNINSTGDLDDPNVPEGPGDENNGGDDETILGLSKDTFYLIVIGAGAAVVILAVIAVIVVFAVKRSRAAKSAAAAVVGEASEGGDAPSQE